jgi:hypothetical protein
MPTEAQKDQRRFKRQVALVAWSLSCPVCKASAGNRCRSPVGKLASDEIHVERKDDILAALYAIRTV